MAPVPPTSRRRRRIAAALLAIVAGLLVLAPAAMAGYFTPEHGGSPNADDINQLYKYVLYVAIVVFVGVESALLYSVLRFRKRKGKLPAQIRGNTRLEIGWTLGPVIVLIVLVVVTFIKLPAINDPAHTGVNGVNVAGSVLYASVNQPPPPGGKALRISVNGQQYIWRFEYPNGAYSYEQMVVPTGTTVILRVVSQDVIHSWWIPKLGGKVDATPGYVNKTWFKIPHQGTYHGQCAELCGRNHANMVASVKAVSPTQYESWVDQQKKLIATANTDAAKQRKTLSPIPG